MRNRKHRLERLGVLADKRRTEREREQERRDLVAEEAYARLEQTMDPKHVRLLGSEDHTERVERLRYEVAIRVVAEVCDERLIAEGYIELRRPLALPRAVAEAYMTDPQAHSAHDCEDCAYRVPIHCGWPNVGPSPTGGSVRCVSCGSHDTTTGEAECGAFSYFPTCPLCGGRTGPEAYNKKHGTRLGP